MQFRQPNNDLPRWSIARHSCRARIETWVRRVLVEPMLGIARHSCRARIETGRLTRKYPNPRGYRPAFVPGAD